LMLVVSRQSCNRRRTPSSAHTYRLLFVKEPMSLRFKRYRFT
jgi:hypothetical protein